MSAKIMLAIDTSETACSVALWHQQRCTQLMEPTARKHSDCVLPMIDALLKAQQLNLAQLDCLTFACGPGAFTGLRLGAALVQGFQYALAIPVIPVSTLLAQAYAGYRQFNIPLVLSALDARMGEIYVAAFEFSPHEFTDHEFSEPEFPKQAFPIQAFQKKCFNLALPEQVLVPEQLSLQWQPHQPWCAVGSGCVYAKALAVQPTIIAETLHCSAANVLACAVDFNLPAQDHHAATLPNYLRQQVVG